MKKLLLPTLLASLMITACNNQNKETANAIQDNKKQTNTITQSTINGPVAIGKYSCTASQYVNGAYEFIPKGNFVLNENGTYAYNGFEEPSQGKFMVDEKGVIHFKGGYFDGGEATPIEDSKNRYYLVFPTNPDNRWSCSLM